VANDIIGQIGIFRERSLEHKRQVHRVPQDDGTPHLVDPTVIHSINSMAWQFDTAIVVGVHD
jgi:hypothetical protein